MNLDAKAGWEHYALAALVILGIWYVIHVIGGAGEGGSPLAQTSVDVTSMVVLSG